MRTFINAKRKNWRINFYISSDRCIVVSILNLLFSRSKMTKEAVMNCLLITPPQTVAILLFSFLSWPFFFTFWSKIKFFAQHGKFVAYQEIWANKYALAFVSVLKKKNGKKLKHITRRAQLFQALKNCIITFLSSFHHYHIEQTWLLCCLVLDRYIAVVKPLKYLTIMKRCRVSHMPFFFGKLDCHYYLFCTELARFW